MEEMQMATVTIRARRDTADNWERLNPIPAEGELCFELHPGDLGKIKLGTGRDAWNDLPYSVDFLAFEQLAKKYEEDLSYAKTQGDYAKNIGEAVQAKLDAGELRGEGLELGGLFDTVEALSAAYPQGNGTKSYLIGNRLFVWNGTDWQAGPEVLLNGVMLSHTRQGTVHVLEGAVPSSGIFTARFKPQAAYVAGDTFQIGGESYSAQYVNGSPLDYDAFAVGAAVSCEVDCEDRKINFKCGGWAYDTLPPQISGFAVSGDVAPLTLTWENPDGSEFDGVRILRREDRIPERPYDGKLVYNGQSESFVDLDTAPFSRYYYRAFSYNSKLHCQTSPASVYVHTSGPEPVVIGDLPFGTDITDLQSIRPCYDEADPAIPMTWTVVGKNHTGYPSDSVILALRIPLSGVYSLDGLEPSSSQRGNSRYDVSNLRQWFNSTGAANEWFVPQHEHDEPSPLQRLSGFLTYLSDTFRALLLKTTLITYNKAEIQDYVFLPSAKELGITNFSSVAPLAREEGTPYAYFQETANLAAFRGTVGANKYMTTRSMGAKNSLVDTEQVACINADNTSCTAWYSYDAGRTLVHPFCCIPSSTKAIPLANEWSGYCFDFNVDLPAKV